jgi:glycosyltransferase involved in cell wall biosynthesis
MVMRFHILGIPHTVTSKEFNACAYTQKVLKFGKMMTKRGHEVIHYGHEDSDLICTEHVSVLTNKDFKIAYDNYDWRKNFFKFDTSDHAYQTFYTNAIREIEKRKQKNDFLLPFWGNGVKPICDAHDHDMIVVEPGIGYGSGSWAKWRIYESYSILHSAQGMKNVENCNPEWYHVVIPNYFDLEDFEYSEEKEDYFLFLSRIYEGKGIYIATQMADTLGFKLIVAGQNPNNIEFGSNVEYIGYADTPTRKRLMSRAKGLIVASLYNEPFGGVQVESFLSGTPVISTDWGAFTEINIQGVTGFRCRTYADFIDAAKNISNIKPSDCRKHGEKYSLENVAPIYEKYFQDVLNVYTGKGWYELN